MKAAVTRLPAAKDSRNGAQAQVTRTPASELRFDVGGPATIATNGMTGKMNGRVVGVSGTAFLIFQIPMVAGIQQRFLAGEEVVVKCQSRGSVYGFRSVVLHLSLKPAPLLFVEFPFVAERFDFRRHTRVNCSLPGTAYCPAGEFPMLMLDLSLGGSRVSIGKKEAAKAKRIDDNDLALLEVHMAGADDFFLGGRIRNVKEEPKAVYLGVQFTSLDEIKTQRITEFIDHVNRFECV